VTAVSVGPTLLLVDTSASHALGLQRTCERLGEVLRALANEGDERVVLAAFDQDVQALHEGTFTSPRRCSAAWSANGARSARRT
jgi:hypothetical protein